MPVINTSMMRQGITTRFLGPTDRRGSRVVAQCDAGRLVVDWRHSAGIAENHAAAAEALARKLCWHGDMVGGSLPGSGYAFVFRT